MNKKAFIPDAVILKWKARRERLVKSAKLTAKMGGLGDALRKTIQADTIETCIGDLEEACRAVRFSVWAADTIGTNDMACVLGLIRESRKALNILEKRSGEQAEIEWNDLRLALLPFESARIA